jgi:hypothetical protein
MLGLREGIVPAIMRLIRRFARKRPNEQEADYGAS